MLEFRQYFLKMHTITFPVYFNKGQSTPGQKFACDPLVYLA